MKWLNMSFVINKIKTKQLNEFNVLLAFLVIYLFHNIISNSYTVHIPPTVGLNFEFAEDMIGMFINIAGFSYIFSFIKRKKN
jgi:hypothetical protein